MITKNYQIIDGIKVFNPEVEAHHGDYDSEGLDALFKEEEKHFWFIARKEYILQKMHAHIPLTNKIIDIGAGTGNVSRYLIENGYQNISTGDMHLNGLKYAGEYGIENRFQFNLLDSPFKKEFEVISLFDVLEHIKDDDLALKNTHTSLSDNGFLVLTVPAHMWLWNRDDDLSGHKTRYSKKRLNQKLINNGFEIIEANYIFVLLTPLFLIRKLINNSNQDLTLKQATTKAFSMPRYINTFLLYLCRCEHKLSKLLPNFFGGSLFVIAKKVDNHSQE